MRSRALQPLVWPLTLLAAGLATGWAAEAAVGRFEAYGLYGFARPVADLLLLIGAVWLVVAAIRIARRRGSDPVRRAAPRA